MRFYADNVAPVLTWSVSGAFLIPASGKLTWLLATNEATTANPLASAISYSSAMTFSTAISALAGNTIALTQSTAAAVTYGTQTAPTRFSLFTCCTAQTMLRQASLVHSRSRR